MVQKCIMGMIMFFILFIFVTSLCSLGWYWKQHLFIKLAHHLYGIHVDWNYI